MIIEKEKTAKAKVVKEKVRAKARKDKAKAKEKEEKEIHRRHAGTVQNALAETVDSGIQRVNVQRRNARRQETTDATHQFFT